MFLIMSSVFSVNKQKFGLSNDSKTHLGLEWIIFFILIA